MTRFWSQLVNRLHPYVPGEQRNGSTVIKLNTNENPYPPSIQVLHAIRELQGDDLRKYPDPESVTLRAGLAAYHGVSVDQVYVGNGSDEILALAFMACFTDAPLQFPQLSYSFYPVYCDLFNIEKRTVALASDYSIDIDQFERGLGGIVIPNPNAPTGIGLGLDHIVKLLKRHADSVVLIDEAYADFGADSAIELIEDHPNLLITRTFSKGRSLAGLRVGALFGQAELIEGVRRVKNSFNSYPLDAIAQVAALASLRDETYYRKTVERIVATRNHLEEALIDRQFNVLPSQANFIFASPSRGDAAELFATLKRQDILVRHWSTRELKDWLRISIGTDAQIAVLLDAVDAHYANS